MKKNTTPKTSAKRGRTELTKSKRSSSDSSVADGRPVETANPKEEKVAVKRHVFKMISEYKNDQGMFTFKSVPSGYDEPFDASDRDELSHRLDEFCEGYEDTLSSTAIEWVEATLMLLPQDNLFGWYGLQSGDLTASIRQSIELPNGITFESCRFFLLHSNQTESKRERSMAWLVLIPHEETSAEKENVTNEHDQTFYFCSGDSLDGERLFYINEARTISDVEALCHWYGRGLTFRSDDDTRPGAVKRALQRLASALCNINGCCACVVESRENAEQIGEMFRCEEI